MDISLPVFLSLVAAGVFGTIAVMPYAFTINRERLADAPLSIPQLVLISIVQSTIFVVIATGLGLILADKVALGAPVVQSLVNGDGLSSNFGDIALLSIILGAITATFVVVINQFAFMPYLPAAFQETNHDLALWKRFLASFYGGITEEILTRLFMMTLFAWLLSHVWSTPDGLPTTGVYWMGIFLAALVFGIAHLPATRAIAPLTPLIVLRALVLNGVFGIVAGYLYWQHGLIFAMVAHFTGDIVLHVISPFFVQSKPVESPVMS